MKSIVRFNLSRLISSMSLIAIAYACIALFNPPSARASFGCCTEPADCAGGADNNQCCIPDNPADYCGNDDHGYCIAPQEQCEP
jgi:hypothetical protein